jgi:acyl-coenzyme A thioesterase PaaI-like protein
VFTALTNTGRMDATGLARSLLDPIPAHRTVGLEVMRAMDGVGVVAVTVRPHLTNVIGSLHSSGLITLIDAAGLAAIIAACPTEQAFDGVVPLGTAASLRFLAPARGRLVATCVLDEHAGQQLTAVLGAAARRARFTTTAVVADETDAVVCEGTFDWSVRRPANAAIGTPPGPRW